MLHMGMEGKRLYNDASRKEDAARQHSSNFGVSAGRHGVPEPGRNLLEWRQGKAPHKVKWALSSYAAFI
jgi:hypothetical protein